MNYPDNVTTIKEKIEFVKDVYGLNGEKGNLFDRLITECKNEQTADAEEISNLLIKGKKPYMSDGINYYSYDWEEIYELAVELKNKL